jgi:hypothetical protein
MNQEFSDTAAQLGAWLWQYANSNFFIACVTAFASAFAGAYGAQFIVNRTEHKRRLLEEIRCTNAATIVAFSITNSFCALKNQHVRSLKNNFDKQRNEHETFGREKAQGYLPSQQQFEIQADFQTLAPVQVPIELLHTFLFEKVSVTGLPLMAVVTLSQCIDGLNTSLDKRNDFVAESKKRSPIPHGELESIYFGAPDKNGRIDRTYPDTIDAISSYTDDCIFFSKLLGDVLMEHGRKLGKLYGRKSPRIHKLDFTKAEKNGLIPDKNVYANWLNMFKELKPSERKSVWFRIAKFITSR